MGIKKENNRKDCFDQLTFIASPSNVSFQTAVYTNACCLFTCLVHTKLAAIFTAVVAISAINTACSEIKE